ARGPGWRGAGVMVGEGVVARNMRDRRAIARYAGLHWLARREGHKTPGERGDFYQRFFAHSENLFWWPARSDFCGSGLLGWRRQRQKAPGFAGGYLLQRRAR